MLSNKNETSRFPFDRFKKENWDIEHIHAIATEMPKNKQHRIDWLNNSKEYINDDELVEVTPRNIRLRKRILDTSERKKYDAGHRL